MAQSAVFGNRIIKLPGVYARVVSGVETDIPLSTYSNVLLIDAGAGKGFNSAKGIIGNGRECIYTLDQSQANFYIKGGPLVPVLEKLWNPAVGADGIGNMFLIKAATSSPAIVSDVSMFGGAITIGTVTTVEEGSICNTQKVGEGDEAELKTGYLLRSVFDTKLNKGYVEILQGTYEGTNLGGYTISQSEENSHPQTIFRSKKCSTPKELVTFLQNSLDFKALVTATNIVAVDPTNWTTKETSEFSFSGGEDKYAKTLADILPMTIDVDYSVMFVLTDEENGTTAQQQLFVAEMKDHFENDAKGIKMGFAYEEDKSLAITQAQEYDSQNIIMTSGICKKTSKSAPTGFIIQDNMVTAAVCLGRIFGLSPEIAGTMKTLNIDGMEIEPTDPDLEDMLDNGVITPYYDADFGSYALSQVCNTLQANTQLINEDCTTYSVQALRILAQVMKNLQQQAKLDFWSGNKGVNKGTLSDAYVKTWTEVLLDKLTVAPNKTENNYLLWYEVTKVETVDDTKKVYISVQVNGEITKIFFLVTVLG